MPVGLQILRIDNSQEIKEIRTASLDSEKRLEEVLVKNINFLNPNLLLIGNQVRTIYGSYIDILAIDSIGNIWVIELKKDKTPREVVAQLLDYGSWASSLTYPDIKALFEDLNTDSFEFAFEQKFGTPPTTESINSSHQLVIVSSSLDPASERIVEYLANFGININAIHFNYFTDDSREYLTRTWLIDPKVPDLSDKADRNRVKEPWNEHDFYVSFGESEYRNWEDAVKYGFISAGGGRWYTNTLNQLHIGARIFVNVPGGIGYVGVGEVKELATPVSECVVKIDGENERPLLSLPLKASKMDEFVGNPDKEEQVVKVEWVKTISREQGYREPGFFGNQNSVCKFRNQFTLNKLVKFFGVPESLDN